MKRLATTLVAGALVLTACQAASETLTEKALEQVEGVEDIDIDADSGQIKVETDDGESISIGGGEIPDDFPVPLPDGGRVLAVFTGNDEASVSVQYEAGSYDDVVAFFTDWVDGQPGEWSSSSSTVETGDGQTMRFTGWSSDEQQVNVNDCSSVDSSDGGLDAVCVIAASF